MAGAHVFIINIAGTEDGIPDLTENAKIPVLQDTVDDRIASCFGASKWYLYVVDTSGNVRFIHYKINLDTEKDRLFEEIALAHGEAK